MFNRLNRMLQGALDPDKVGERTGRQPTLESLLPGDVVSLWDDGDCVVEAVLECSESLNGRITTWRWNLLDGGRMVETGPDGSVLYTRSDVLKQSSPEFETLTCDPENGGVLKLFEQRVQQGLAARNPSLFEYDGGVLQVRSTGAFGVKAAEGVMPKAPVWRDLNLQNPGDNVYFVMERTDAAEEDEDAVILGVWTTHIALLFGKPLKSADVASIYPRNEGEPKRA